MGSGILRFQIRSRLKKLRNEDKEIMWEGGPATLNESELKVEMRARGLPTSALTADQMRDTLDNWLALSQKKEVPYTLLILMNMLHFAGAREAQKQRGALLDAAPDAKAASWGFFGWSRGAQAASAGSGGAADDGAPTGKLDVDDAAAALATLPTSAAFDSTLATDDEKLKELELEEALIEEVRAPRC